MRIYVITARAAIDYDCYDKHVVAAHTEQEARGMCPTGDETRGEYVAGMETTKGWQQGYCVKVPFWTDPKYSTARHVGASLKHLKPEVLCSSFNAG